jgi:hypothetical protein
MAQIFHRSANTIARSSLVLLVILAGSLFWMAGAFDRSDYNTDVSAARPQPVPFSHRHHVAGLGMDCRYCHTTVETSAFAGIPPTETCMTCHSQIWADSPMLEPVRSSFRSGESIRWTRVHDLPGFVYFDHSIHLKKGMGCESCHGRVDQMPLIWKTETLQMEWCLDCHRNPEKNIRPRSEVFTMGYKPEGNQLEIGRKLVDEYKVQKLTDCNTCHR